MPTVRSTACRCAAAFASLLAACAVAACTTTVEGTARYADVTPSPDQPLVKIAQLKELLPSDRETGAVMDAPTSEVALTYTSLEAQPDDTLSDPHCIGAMFGTVEPVYRGSGYQGVYGERIWDPATEGSGRLDQGVVAFGSAEDAAAYVSKQTDIWRECVGRPLTLTALGQQVSWNASPPTLANGVDVLARTQEGGGGFGCARGLAAGSNVVADVVVCGNDGADVAGQATQIVNMILEKIPA